ncbi:DUF547 domain-containing protein [Nonlabens ponticola]|uniref:DUF547 domain-containing protein n=1 Tax=Nonlabens ponticola TaxID=2496866 RepID=A0A3S9N076_9FLAO|nr:DUF547 domain-containing protein [Nonlabens ponticola]AZQ44788.1 DUF547 domain-containing protein [Nonlabens ponticola]
MKNLFALLFLIIVSNYGQAQTASFYEDTDAFLKTYVSNGKVDYAAIKKDPSSLNKLITQAEAINVSKSSPADYQAFWINAYNLHVINGLVEAYPVNSPLDVKGFFDNTKREVGGETLTLNDIENKKLREQFNDARVHFVLVCGALGCPPIIPNTYKPDTLDRQLTAQTSKAINNPSFIKTKGKKLQVSQIFEWYAQDFNQGENTTLTFINAYLTNPVDENTKVSFYTYNWKINKL